MLTRDYNPALERQKQVDPGAHWPFSLAYLVRLSQQKGKRWTALEEQYHNIQHYPLATMSMDIHAHTPTHTCAHTHTSKALINVPFTSHIYLPVWQEHLITFSGVEIHICNHKSPGRTRLHQDFLPSNWNCPHHTLRQTLPFPRPPHHPQHQPTQWVQPGAISLSTLGLFTYYNVLYIANDTTPIQPQYFIVHTSHFFRPFICWWALTFSTNVGVKIHCQKWNCWVTW